MDDATLRSLQAALQASPTNAELRGVLMRGHLQRGELDDAKELLGDRELSTLPGVDVRRTAAEVCLALQEGKRALSFLTEDGEPAAKILRCRAHLLNGERPEALLAYREAVAENPTLEDIGLKLQLGSTTFASKGTTPDGQADRPRLSVISNDDTDQTEMNRLLHPADETVTFRNVGGHASIKDQVRKKIILPFQKPALFQRFKKRVGGGILLYGPPGCGKTLLARATAGECEAQFFNIAINDILDMYIGESEQKLHAIFEKARAQPPSVLFFDELEALAGKRQFSRELTSSKLVSQFLSEMDGFTKNNQGVLVLGATNVPWAIDPAFRRPGRFDRVLFVPPPDRMARAAILDLQLSERPCEDGLDCTKVAERITGFSGADIANLVDTASDFAIEESLETQSEVAIKLVHILSALKEVKATTSEWLTSARNYARYANEGGQYDEVLDFLQKHSS